jgi:chromosome segregation ATPase
MEELSNFIILRNEMSNESYVNYYIDILTKSLNEAILNNISLQANFRIASDATTDLSKKLEESNNRVEELNSEIQDNKKTIESLNRERQEYENTKHQLQHLETFRNEIQDNKKTIESLNRERQEYENVKNQLRHLETFRNELVVAREENKKLTTEVERLTTEVESLKNKKRKITKASSVDTEEINIVSTPNDF